MSILAESLSAFGAAALDRAVRGSASRSKLRDVIGKASLTARSAAQPLTARRSAQPLNVGTAQANSGLVIEVQRFRADRVLRGVGGPVAKSLELLRVSVQPFAFLNTEVVLLGAGVGPP